MKYHITINTNTGKVYEFIASDTRAKDFSDFVNGVNKEKEQFFTFVGGDSYVMVSRRSIEYVMFEAVEEEEEDNE